MKTKATVVPIGDEHKDGNGHLTDEGWAVCRGTGKWFTCYDAGGEMLRCVDEGHFEVNPTVVITLS